MSPDLGHSWAPSPPSQPMLPSCRTGRGPLPFMVQHSGWHPPCPWMPCLLQWAWCAHLGAHPLGVFADCSQPLDVVLLLDGSSSLPASSFDEMKSFAKAFISKANIGEGCP